ncbi:MAG: hypothetical protein IKZ95_02530, partial [Lachnospiraceae bacterium]|nr:hypothetical protein [Lachnospiraceae bacterium]
TVVFGDATSSEVTFTIAPKGSKIKPDGGGSNGNRLVIWMIVITAVILAGIAAAVILFRKRDQKL